MMNNPQVYNNADDGGQLPLPHAVAGSSQQRRQQQRANNNNKVGHDVGTGPNTDNNGGSSSGDVMAGWMTKLGGHTVKMWRRRYFSYDRCTGQLQYSKDDSASGGAKGKNGGVLGVISIPHVLYVTLRTDDEVTGGGMWPTGVPTKRCLQIVSQTRTYSMYCDSADQAQRWIHELRCNGSGGDPTFYEHVGIEIEVTAAGGQSGEATTGNGVGSHSGMLLTNAVKIRGTPDVPASEANDETGSIVHQYSLDNVPQSTRSNITKWHAIMASSLEKLNAELGLKEYDEVGDPLLDRFVVECDLGAVHDAAPHALRRRLGEYVLGDYMGEMCHSLITLARQPIGRQTILEAIPTRSIRLEVDERLLGEGAEFTGATRSRLVDGGIVLGMNAVKLGTEAHRVADDVINLLRVTSSAQRHSLLARAQSEVDGASKASHSGGEEEASKNASSETPGLWPQGVPSSLNITAHATKRTSDDVISRGTTPSNRSDSDQSSRCESASPPAPDRPASSPGAAEDNNDDFTEQDTWLAECSQWYAELEGARVSVAVGALDAEPLLARAVKKLRRWVPGLRSVHLSVQWRELDDVIAQLVDGDELMRRGFGRIVVGHIVPAVLTSLAAQCGENRQHAATVRARAGLQGVLGLQVRAPRKNPASSRRLLQLRFRPRAQSLVIGVYPARLTELASSADVVAEAARANVAGWLASKESLKK